MHGETAKAVREAPTASEDRFLEPPEDLYREIPENLPRYTVELTTEGWQIKDNVKGTIKADAYSDKLSANVACEAFEEFESKIDTAKEHDRRWEPGF